MKLKIFLLLFPIFLFGQKSIENSNEIKLIESRLKFADSISSFTAEETQNIEVIPAHGRIDGEPTESTKINIRILKHSNQVLRICYNQSNSKEFWKYYYYDSKLIYAELNKLRGKREMVTKKKFYFQNENLISPSYSDRNYDVEEEVKIFIKGKELLKSSI
ncbi:MAG: hypothetical protein H7239_09695 [Flavobacterium sp.]|nr:hypothetical protein [Flavobacterium sp.]